MEKKKEEMNNISEEMIEQSQDEDGDEENDYKIWKKNAPYLYDVLITWGLDWPSLCVNWLPRDNLNNNYSYIQKMIIGTYTSGQENDYLMIAKTRLPIQPKNEKISNEEAINSFSKIENKIEIETKIRHEGEVNKAKAMPQKFNIIATKTNSGEVHIYDYYKHPTKPDEEKGANPNKRLKGHTDIGYGLSWSKFQEGYLLSGAYDQLVCFWDIEKSSEPIHTYHNHSAQCEDVCFSKKNDNLFASCGDDKNIILYDLRSNEIIQSIIGHECEINSIDFNPTNEFIYITGSNDKTVALWDIRKPDLKLHSFIHHKEPVTSVKWNHKRGNIFSSAGDDKKVLLWDLTQIGANISREDNEEAPSEMIFEHGGHMDKINDLDWNSSEDMMCASVDNKNNLQIWELNINSLLK